MKGSQCPKPGDIIVRFDRHPKYEYVTKPPPETRSPLCFPRTEKVQDGWIYTSVKMMVLSVIPEGLIVTWRSPHMSIVRILHGTYLTLEEALKLKEESADPKKWEEYVYEDFPVANEKDIWI